MLESGADKGDVQRPILRARTSFGDNRSAADSAARQPPFRSVAPVADFQRGGRRSSPADGIVPAPTVVMPTVAPVAEAVRQAAAKWPVPTVVVESAEICDAFAASRAALSGVGHGDAGSWRWRACRIVMLPIASNPPLSAYAFRRLTRTPYVNLVNVLVGRAAVPEMLQENCEPARLAEAMSLLIDDEDARQRQKAAFMEATARLAPIGETPSHLAAQIVLRMIENGRAQVLRI